MSLKLCCFDCVIGEFCWVEYSVHFGFSSLGLCTMLILGEVGRVCVGVIIGVGVVGVFVYFEEIFCKDEIFWGSCELISSLNSTLLLLLSRVTLVDVCWITFPSCMVYQSFLLAVVWLGRPQERRVFGGNFSLFSWIRRKSVSTKCFASLWYLGLCLREDSAFFKLCSFSVVFFTRDLLRGGFLEFCRMPC